MNIPAVVLSEACQTPMNEDEPTLPSSAVSKLWHDAALSLAQRLVETAHARHETLDTDVAERCFLMAHELQNLAKVLDTLPSLQPETAAQMRRQCVDRVMKMYEDAARFFPSK